MKLLRPLVIAVQSNKPMCNRDHRDLIGRWPKKIGKGTSRVTTLPEPTAWAWIMDRRKWRNLPIPENRHSAWPTTNFRWVKTRHVVMLRDKKTCSAIREVSGKLSRSIFIHRQISNEVAAVLYKANEFVTDMAPSVAWLKYASKISRILWW